MRDCVATKCAYALLFTLVSSVGVCSAQETNPRKDALNAEVWRSEHRIFDMHTHVEGRPEQFAKAAKILEFSGVGTAIELGSGTVTAPEGKLSQFEKVKAVGDAVCPGQFIHYMLIDYSGWDEDDWSEKAVKQIEKGHRLGAAGLKEFKRLGLYLRDGKGELIKVDDPKLDPVWKRCGELGMPISIHVGDPQAFWEPYNETNERWDELKDHPSWWFGDPKKYPPRMQLLDALERVIGRHPETTFVGVHFANNPEDIDWVDRQFDKYPNMRGDLAARIPEIGRHEPEKLRNLFVKHKDRLLFGTDFQSNRKKFILGSSGDDEFPTNLDALIFFEKCWRFMETDDRDWPHMTPIQGNWNINSVDLPPEVQRAVYFDNARKMLARSWPKPTTKAIKVASDFEPDGHLREDAWRLAPHARVEYSLKSVDARPELSTSVRVLWSDKYLYLAYEAPYTKLTMKKNPGTAERFGLWEDDVVEVFIAPDPSNVNAYSEYEWCPNGEQLDLQLDLPKKDFEWSSGMESAVSIDEENKIYRVEARIPLSAISSTMPQPGDRWRVNFYRNDNAGDVFLAWNPTLTNTAHTPSQMGWLVFEGQQ